MKKYIKEIGGKEVVIQACWYEQDDFFINLIIGSAGRCLCAAQVCISKNYPEDPADLNVSVAHFTKRFSSESLNIYLSDNAVPLLDFAHSL